MSQSSRFDRSGGCMEISRRRSPAPLRHRTDALDVHDEIVGIAGTAKVPAGVQPGGTPEPADARISRGFEFPRWHVFAPQDQPQVPGELEADELAHEGT